MTTPGRPGQASIPCAADHAALCADLAHVLPLAAGLAAIVGQGAMQPLAEPGQTDHGHLVADVTKTHDLPDGVREILDTHSGYNALLIKLRTDLNLTAGLTSILRPSPAQPGPASTPPSGGIEGDQSRVTIWPTGTIESTTRAALDRIAAGPGRLRLQMRLGARHRTIQAAMRAISDIRDLLAQSTVHEGAGPVPEGIPVILIRNHDLVVKVIAALAGALPAAQRTADRDELGPLPRAARRRQGGLGSGLFGGGLVPAREVAERAKQHASLQSLVRQREQAGDHDGALALAREAAARGNLGVLGLLVELREQAGDHEGALALAREAAERDNRYALKKLVGLRERAGDHEGALALAREAAEQGSPDALGELAELWEQAGDQSGALTLAREAAEQGHLNVFVHLASLRAQAGDHEGALSVAREAADLGAPGALRDLARLRERSGDHDGALALTQEAARSDRDRALRRKRAGDSAGALESSGGPVDREAPDLAPDRDQAQEEPESPFRSERLAVGADGLTQVDTWLRQVLAAMVGLHEPELLHRLEPGDRQACREVSAGLAVMLLQISEVLGDFQGEDLRGAMVADEDLEDLDGACWCDATSGAAPTRWPAAVEGQIIEHSEALPWEPGTFVIRFGASVQAR